MTNRYRLSRLLMYFFIFTCIAIFLSFLTGYVWRNSYFIVFLSIGITYFLGRNKSNEFEVPKGIQLLAVLIFLVFLAPLIVYTPYYPGSADAAGTTIVRILGERIPDTYAPYSDLRLTYQIGFHLFAKLFVDLLPFVNDYLILWFLGALLASLQVILLYNLARVFFGSDSYGEWLAILLVGTKTLYQYGYWGMAPALLYVDLFLVFFVLFIQGNKLYYLFFPATFAVHPMGWALTVFFTSIYSLYFDRLKDVIKVFPTVFLVIPFVFKTYFAYITNLQHADSFPYTRALSLPEIEKFSIVVILYFGVVPALFTASSLLWMGVKGGLDNRHRFILSTFVLSLAAYTLVYFIGHVNAGIHFIEWVTLSGLLVSGLWLTQLKFGIRFKTMAQILVLFLCLASFVASSEMDHLRRGSKVSREEVEFAFEFYDFDPRLEKTLFLSPGAGWMAHISNKIPYDATVGHLVPPTGAHNIRNAAWDETIERTNRRQYVLNNGCIECIYQLNVTYVVVDRKYFDHPLKEEPVLRYKHFELYKIDAS